MEPITHNNHYIPQLYLRNFSFDGNHVWAYHLLVSHENVPEWEKRSISNTAFLRDLYTDVKDGKEVDDFEKWLMSEFEDPVQESLRKVLKDNPLSKNDWERLVRFLAAQDVRTPKHYSDSMERWKKTVPDLLEKTLKKAIEKVENNELSGEIAENDEMYQETFSEILRVKPIHSEDSENGKAYLLAELVAGRKFWFFQQKKSPFRYD